MTEPAGVVPDQILLWGLSHGSSEASGELRRRHAKSLYALAYGVLWDSDLADTVVHEVFERAERTAYRFRANRGSVFRWLTSLAREEAQTAAATFTPLHRLQLDR